MTTLRPYQAEALEAVLTSPEKGIKRPMVVLPTGMGKTVLFTSIAREMNTRTLVIAHREELLTQAKDKFRSVWPGVPVGIVQGRKNEYGAKVVAASIQTLINEKRIKQLGDFGLIIVDECFPAGTIIDGRPIEEVKPGDSVTAWDEHSKMFVQSKVNYVFKKKPNHLLRINAGEKQVVCTPNHPFYTKRGWIPAALLNENDQILYTWGEHLEDQTTNNGYVHSLQKRNNDYKKTQDRFVSKNWKNLLFRLLPRHLVKSRVFQKNGENQSEICIQTDERKQSHVQTRNQRKGENHFEGNGLETQSERRKWNRVNNAAKKIIRSFGLGNRSCSANQNSQRARVSHLLQNRYRRSKQENRNRSRWFFSLFSRKTETGCKKRTTAEWVRLDHIEILESGSDGKFGGVCPDGYVYNFEVAKYHTYVANGFVVHNCHHAAADSYMEVLGNLKAFEENGPVVLGVTATPNRSDGLGLDSTFQEIVYEKDILYGIENGYLCDLRGIVCRLDIDFKKLKTRAGDFQAGSSAELLLAAGAPKYTVEAYQEHANGRKGVVFTPTVEVAEQMADAFNKAGIPSAAISGKSKKEDRRNILKALDTGEIQMVANCGVLTEGFDQPDISCVIIARPTKSQGLYIQMVGRGTRLAPGKEDCIVIDMVGASDRNDLITMPSLYGTKTGETITEAKERKEQEEKDETSKPTKSIEIDGKLVTEVKDLFKRSGFNWGELDGKYHLQYGSGTIWIVPKPNIALNQETEKIEWSKSCWHVFNRYKNGYIEMLHVLDDLDEARVWGEEYIRSLGNSAFTLANKSAEWRKEPATQKQINFLRRNKIQFRPNLTKGQASRLIIDHKARGGVR